MHNLRHLDRLTREGSLTNRMEEMERRRRIEIPGRGQIDVTEVGFRSSGEYWNEYLLDDGTIARLKLVVTSVYRLDGERDPKGQPAYIIESSNVTSISAPDEGAA